MLTEKDKQLIAQARAASIHSRYEIEQLIEQADTFEAVRELEDIQYWNHELMMETLN